MTRIDPRVVQQLWNQTLAEDGAERDITSLISIDENARGKAVVASKTDGIFAGAVLLDQLKAMEAHHLRVDRRVDDSDVLRAGTAIAQLEGSLRHLLSIERTLLNFLQRMCGVATLTRKYVYAVAGTGAEIYDTRKTIPGWRQLDKYAVRCGGGFNHRMGLHDAILVKDNHLAGIPISRLAGRVSEMIAKASSLEPRPAFFEIEVDTLEQYDELLKVAGIDLILLDNFGLDQMREAVRRRDAAGLRGTLRLEASGGVELPRVRDIARTGVDCISVGALTHSAPALDIHMEIDSEK